MMRWIACLLLGGMCPLTTLADEPAAYRWIRSISLPEFSAVTPVIVPLDSHLFEATRPGWPDVRLRDADGQVRAFVIRQARVEKRVTVRRHWTAQQTGATLDDAQGLRLQLQLRDDDPQPQGIRIVTPLKDFEQQVRIEASADGTTWEPLDEPAIIFDYSRLVDARNAEVPFAKGTQRLFRVVIDQVTSDQQSPLRDIQQRFRGEEETDRAEYSRLIRRPFRIDRVEFYHEESVLKPEEPHTVAYPVERFTVTQDDKRQVTVIEFETRREPITSVALVTSSENFRRRVHLEAHQETPDGQHIWKELAAGTLTRFAVGSLHKSELELRLPESRQQRYRLAIENADSPPLAIDGVTAAGNVYELAFLAQPQDQLTVEYGSAAATAGRYDAGALTTALASGVEPLKGTWEAPRDHPLAGAAAERPWTPWNSPTVQISAIVALTLLLGYGLFQAGKKIELPPAG